ncbi:hypothetical protein SAY87_004682 [Trapa incisa]|uniref:E3 ubiquitin-protein ligase LIN-1 n=1 Tax=Trapa incisa TaxID=236973 RepID=A0AAN7JP83_9MYRT|nr:hypothetical protein SAY87_004682 [Trapa incisa]
MSSSLQELIAEEAFGFDNGKLSEHRPVRPKQMATSSSRDELLLPIYICRDVRSHDRRKPRNRPRSSSCSERPESAPAASESSLDRRDHRPHEAVMDEVAIKAVASILSGYTGRYLRDPSFRTTIRRKCKSCLMMNRTEEPDHRGAFATLEAGMDNIEKLQMGNTHDKELRVDGDRLRNAIKLLNIVTSLNSKDSSINSSTCGIPNSYLSACAHLYLSVAYKLGKSDRVSARHLLQVFVDSPFLARAHLLVDLWEHLFLPHLLHIKVWYSKELESLCGTANGPEKDKRMKELGKVYNKQLDVGTARFGVYYKKWLKVGAEAPPLPYVPMPSVPAYRSSSRRQSSDSNSSMNRNLYQVVFGDKQVRRMSLDHELPREKKSSRNLEIEGDWRVSIHAESYSCSSYDDNASSRRSRSEKQNYLQVFPCQSMEMEYSVSENLNASSRVIDEENHGGRYSGDLVRAISAICSSDDLAKCEMSVQVIAKARLTSKGDPVMEASVSRAPVVEGMLEVLFASEDDAILELAISLLAETVAKDETSAHVILSSDPQLEVFMRLLKRTSVFLKAAVLLYLLKPMSKQMISTDWVPLVLRVLEFGDQPQILFSVQCLPRTAALYFLGQLLLDFDEDKALENAREVVSLGGLELLIRRICDGELHDRTNAVLITMCCIRADGTSRNYVVENLKMSSLVELLLMEFNASSWSALNLLAELLLLNRRRQISNLLDQIKRGGGLNIMHILLVHLLKSSAEVRPIIAVILMQMDLLEGHAKCSIFKEEAMEALAEALDCSFYNENVQEKAAKALTMLAGRFTSKGEATAEQWLLQQSGFHEYSSHTFGSKHSAFENSPYLDECEEEEGESWLSKTATILLGNGCNRFLTALSSSIDNGIPVLARASLVTFSWLSRHLNSMGDKDLKSTACSLFIPQMIQSINYDRALEERVLASLSLLNLVKGSGLVNLLLSSLTEGSMSHLRNLSLVTWTAEELITIINTSSNHQYRSPF